MLAWLFTAFLGLSGGLAVGCGFVAFITVLDIIPRLYQLLGGAVSVQWLEKAVIWGVISAMVIDFSDVHFHFLPFGTAFIGLLQGMFIGMLAAALTEVLNVFPILAKRLKLDDVLVWLLMAVVFGKVVGSLFDWMIYQTS
ncbi:stage V sporulation protein AB [Marinicrinis sediminis]|uniref:Stage V sporulation protein AB n=1 Tax=Marinicrinis sediminis TaxID=1652465 RepID=A0ABW5RD00_9BACL